eukprot:a345486_21.p1 GENE.a345486_21~~a345486_21.p1  ORF type:complete len:636 (+),score=269.46 a345486_21:62-1909(+)
MGKAKQDRAKARKERRGEQDGLGITSVSPSGSSAGRAGSSSKTSELLRQMSSEDPESREIACGTLATIAASAGALDEFLARPVIDQLKVCLFDPVAGVQITAAGALRNLASSSPTAAEKLAKSDLAGAALSILERVVAHCDSGRSEPERERDFELLENMLGVLCALCEVSQAVTRSVSNSEVIAQLVGAIDPTALPRAVIAETCQLLLVLSDRNAKFARALCALPQCRETFAALAVHESDTTLAAFGCCVLVELAAVTDQVDSALGHVRPTVAALLSNDAGLLLAEMHGSMRFVDDGPEPPERQSWRALVLAQKLVLEMLANVSAPDETAEDWTRDASVPITEGGGDNLDMLGGLTETRVAALDPGALLGLVLPKCTALPDALHQAAAADPDLLELVGMYYGVMTRALGVAGNCVLCLPVTDPAAQVLPLWTPLCALLAAAADIDRLLLQTGATSACHEAVVTAALAVTRKAAAVAPGQLAPDAATVDGLFTAATAGITEGARAQALMLLTLLAQGGLLDPQLGALGELFVSLLRDQSLAVVAEAVNGCLDLFAETDHNAVVAATGMVPALEAKLKALQRLLNSPQLQDLDEALICRLDETAENLANWLEYKSSQ